MLRRSVVQQEIVHQLKAFHAVIIVRVHGGEGAVHQRLGAQGGVRRAPRLRALRGHGKPLRPEGVHGLEGVFQFHVSAHALADDLVKVLFHAGLDHQNHGFKARARRVENRIVHHNVARVVHWRDLLQSAAAKAAAHARRHDD